MGSEPKKRFAADEVLKKACSGALEGVDLHGLNLKQAELHDALLRNTDLTGAKLRKSNLRNADLSGANLSGADLSFADLTGADLSSANLECACLKGVILESARAKNSDFSDADLSKIRIVKSDLSGANMERIIAPQCRIESSRFEGANLAGADLSESQIVDSDMSYADISEAAFLDSRLERVSAVNIQGAKAMFSLSRIKETDFFKADLFKANFFAVSFEQVDFREANVQRAKFKSVKGLSNEALEELKARGARDPGHVTVQLVDWLQEGKRLHYLIGMIPVAIVAIVLCFLAWNKGSFPEPDSSDLSLLPTPYQAKAKLKQVGFTILCIGDSHTRSPDLAEEMDYPSQLEALLNNAYSEPGYRVINEGYSGDNSSQSVERLINRLEENAEFIDLVIFSSGKNNEHQLTRASFLPKEIREEMDRIFPYLLEKKDFYHFSSKTVLNLKSLNRKGIAPEDAGWGMVLNMESEVELDLLLKWLKIDLQRLLKTLKTRGINLVLMNYYHNVLWVDAAFVSFALEHDLVYANITDFDLDENLMVPKLTTSNFRPNKYGNARITEILHQAFIDNQLLNLHPQRSIGSDRK